MADATRARLGWLRHPLTSLVLLLVVTAVAVVLALQLHGERSRNSDRTAAIAAADAVAKAVATYDYNTLDANFKAVLDKSADPFKQDYSTTAPKLKAAFVQYKATSTATLLGSGVESQHGNAIVVVLFVDQSVLNTQTKAPRIDRNRLRITMKHVGGRWLATDLSLA